MGCAQSSPGSRDEKSTNNKLTRELRAQQAKAQKTKKLLLLGAGESGKSTFLKQMRLLYVGGFSDAEKATYLRIIHSNIVDSIHTILKYIIITKGKYADDIREIAADAMQLPSQPTSLSAEQLTLIKKIWAAASVQRAYTHRSHMQIMDNAAYFLNRIDEIANPLYVPSVQDILCSRVRTTGIVELDFIVEGVEFRMFDVGGQRNERRKWIHCFEGVDAVLFLVGLSEYDQKLMEDNDTNRMKEALALFDEICNSRFFTNTAMILFFNKSDLFRDKLERVPLKKHFPDYTGENFESAVEYFQNKFVAVNGNQNRDLFVHITCATDTSNIRVVFDAVRRTIISQNLAANGLM